MRSGRFIRLSGRSRHTLCVGIRISRIAWLYAVNEREREREMGKLFHGFGIYDVVLAMVAMYQALSGGRMIVISSMKISVWASGTGGFGRNS